MDKDSLLDFALWTTHPFVNVKLETSDKTNEINSATSSVLASRVFTGLKAKEIQK